MVPVACAADSGDARVKLLTDALLGILRIERNADLQETEAVHLGIEFEFQQQLGSPALAVAMMGHGQMIHQMLQPGDDDPGQTGLDNASGEQRMADGDPSVLRYAPIAPPTHEYLLLVFGCRSQYIPMHSDSHCKGTANLWGAQYLKMGI